MTTAPFHTSTIGRCSIRFYRSPRTEPDFLWCAFLDALALAEFPIDGQQEVITRWKECWPDMVRELPDGTTIVPQVAVVGLLEWGQSLGWDAAENLLQTFRTESSRLFAVQHANLPKAAFRIILEKALLQGAIVIPGVHRAN